MYLSSLKNIYDYLHSLRFTTDGTRALKAAYDYYPYGAPVYSLTNSDTDADPTFASHEQDEESGQYYAKQRFYDPETGRFNRLDPMQDNLNWYAYCGGDPVNSFDPWGLEETEGAINPDGDSEENIIIIDPIDSLTNQGTSPIFEPIPDDIKIITKEEMEILIEEINTLYAEYMLSLIKDKLRKRQTLSQSEIDWLVNYFLDPENGYVTLENSLSTSPVELENFFNEVLEALKYLCQTEGGVELILDLIDAIQLGKLNKLRIVKVGINDYRSNSFNYSNSTITWISNYGLVTSSGGILSPALTLAHELGHARQYAYGICQDYWDFIEKYGAILDPNNPLYLQYQTLLDQMENENVQNTENVIASQLNALGYNEGNRKFYEDTVQNNFYVPVMGSTSTTSLYEYIIVANQVLFINQELLSE